MSQPDRIQAVTMLLALAASIWWRQPLLTCAAALAVFAARIAWERNVWQAAGRFGPANAVTALRIVLIAALALLPSAHFVPWAGVVVLFTFVLDGVDGLLARRTGITSSFGSQFDQEADAFTVAAATLLACHHGLLPGWFIVPGLLRYVYVIAVWTLGAPREAPRSRWGRWAYTAFVVGLISLLILPAPWTQGLATVGTLALLASFSRSYWQVIADYRARQ